MQFAEYEAQAPSFPFNPFNDGVLSHASFGFQDTSFGGTINGAGEVPYNTYSSSNSLNNATSLPGVQRASHHINRFHPYLSTSHRSNYGTAPILAPLFSPPNILAPAASLMAPSAPTTMVLSTPASMVPTAPASMVPTAPASMVPTAPASMVPTAPASMVPTAPTSMVPFIPAPAISLSIASTPEVQNEEPKGPEVITSALDFNQYCEMNGYN
ncbi:hypothetical protein F5879DRAFT_994952 [Lentinula edodes]|nr:hypothetical protein F5879DRAFT_994952 [Lentinula edodes]